MRQTESKTKTEAMKIQLLPVGTIYIFDIMTDFTTEKTEVGK